MQASTVRLEARPWAEDGRSVHPDVAFERMVALAQANGSRVRGYCVYVHVPFCATMCRFCALYTHAVHDPQSQALGEYVHHLQRHIERHPFAGRPRAPSTVHFGGGTPLHLGWRHFEALVQTLRNRFGDDGRCEWALEMTTASATRRQLQALRGLGFTRLHLGVQTLDDASRARDGLALSGAQALERVREAAAGFACSVDLILGLDGGGDDEVCWNVRRLFDAGVRMFSICELRHRKARPMSAAQHATQSERNCRTWLRVWQLMNELGLRPIHQGQFGRDSRDNLYFTHPLRDEDCVALGAYANGNAGPLHYTNLLLPAYSAAMEKGASPIARAACRDAAGQALYRLERELLGHCLQALTLHRAQQFHPQLKGIDERWREQGWLTPWTTEGRCEPTAQGAWFVGNMVVTARHAMAVAA